MIRLTQKNKKLILQHLDDIIQNHRLKMYQQLVPDLNSTHVSEIRFQIGQMNAQLVRDVLPMLEELVKTTPPVLSLLDGAGIERVNNVVHRPGDSDWLL